MARISKAVSRKAAVEEVPAVPQVEGSHLSPQDLGMLAKQLAAASNPLEAAQLKERLTRGFYGF